MPALLSQTGAFEDVRSLTPSRSLLPYDLNVPFWSDGALKRRWISVPNAEGGESATVYFSPTGEWQFPPGTVFVKHFELPLDESHRERTRRLETRLLVCAASGGVYGASYRWRADHSDAELVKTSVLAPVEIGASSGVRTQNWFFPGPEECGKCHVPSAGGVLGVNTRQLNRNFSYPDGQTDNQLRRWSRLGLLNPAAQEAELLRLPKLARPDDHSRSVEERARSWLDANCAYCHRSGGAVTDFDARYETPLAQQKLLGAPVRINLGIDGAAMISPNDVWRSMVLHRTAALDGRKMPPLAHEMVDPQGVALLAAWIKSLPGPPVLAPPAISPPEGDYRAAVRVMLQHDDPQAVIRYTLDGAAPTATSPIYQGPIELTAPATVRARAYKEGSTRSISVHATFVVGP
jgi:uncharacterized repeat protein (TIGR03806 family)